MIERQKEFLLIGKYSCRVRGRQWGAEQKALHFNAVQRTYHFELAQCFHAFRNQIQPKAFRDGHDGGNDRRITRVGGDVLHERLIDLNGVDWKLLQVVERRIVDTEVVDRNLHTERA